MIYHPIANLIIQALEKKSIRYSKDLYEISFIQSSSGAAERFTSISVSTFVSEIQSFLKGKFFGTLYTSTMLGTVEEKKFGTKPYRLLFNPIDSFLNFSRGMANFGISFSLQEETENGVFDIFSIIYNLQTQDIIYSDETASYIKGRILKPIIRKNIQLAVLACNVNAIKNEPKLLEIKNITISNSILHDISLASKGKIDIIKYDDIPLSQVIPLLLLAKSLRMNCNEIPLIEISTEISRKSTSVLFTNQSLKESL